MAVFEVGLLQEGRAPAGKGGREQGAAILLPVTSGERGAGLHFAKAETLLMRVMGAPATSVIHCGLKESAQEF